MPYHSVCQSLCALRPRLQTYEAVQLGPRRGPQSFPSTSPIVLPVTSATTGGNYLLKRSEEKLLSYYYALSRTYLVIPLNYIGLQMGAEESATLGYEGETIRRRRGFVDEQAYMEETGPQTWPRAEMLRASSRVVSLPEHITRHL
jgi:hypothetical protein